jgi:hypothetical protein
MYYTILLQYLEKGDGIYFGNCIHFDELSSSGIFSLFSSVGKNENAAS